MAKDLIRYDLLAQEALRGVVRRVLADVAKKGLPGEHHFYITLDTRVPGVKISPRLLAQHPEEMTVILQHQFWDLEVTDRTFEVGLSFNRVPERLVVPFQAIKGFFDPSVQFGLQFEAAAADLGGTQPAATAPAQSESGTGIAEKVTAPTTERQFLPAKPAAPAEMEPQPSEGGGEVVRLDRFRKK